jgi:hypothetical protein
MSAYSNFKKVMEEKTIFEIALVNIFYLLLRQSQLRLRVLLKQRGNCHPYPETPQLS